MWPTGLTGLPSGAGGRLSPTFRGGSLTGQLSSNSSSSVMNALTGNHAEGFLRDVWCLPSPFLPSSPASLHRKAASGLRLTPEEEPIASA